MQQHLKSGYTTGACAAAAVKASLLFLFDNRRVDAVELTALDGTPLEIPIKNIRRLDDETIRAEVVKFSGDDPDITDGISIFTTVRLIEGGEIKFIGGEGVGRVTKPGLQLSIGEPAINPGPRKLIRNVVDEFKRGLGVEVTIEIPNGVELARRTLNPTLGIEGGLSIIGTTGVLRPMSEDAFKRSLVPQIDVAIADGFRSLIFVPGNIGRRSALDLKFPRGAVIETSNFIGFMLEAAVERHVENVLLLGHIGKLAKVAAGVFHTHNRVGDGRLETIAAYAAAEGLENSAVKKILECRTTEEAIEIIAENNCESVYNAIAERASRRAERYVFGELRVGTILTAFDGRILGIDQNARELGAAMNIKLSPRETSTVASNETPLSETSIAASIENLSREISTAALITTSMREHKIIVAGIGPGGAEFITPAARNAIVNAEILIGGRRALSQFAAEGQLTFPITADIQAAVDFIRAHRETSDIVVMVSGDPGYFSMLDVLLREFDRNTIEILPSISAMQLAFARAKMPWHDATLLSFHGRRPSDSELEYRRGRVLGFLTDGKFHSQSIAQILLDKNYPPSTRLTICSRLSYDDETILSTTLENAARNEPIKHCILIVGGDDDD